MNSTMIFFALHSFILLLCKYDVCVNMHTHTYMIFFLLTSFLLLSSEVDYFSFLWEGREIITVEFKGSENSLGT